MYQNKVTLIGFLGNNAEVHTANERSFTTFSLATKSSYKDKKSGEYVSHTEWHRCVVFGRLSEFAGTLTKGTHVQVEGELRSREYVRRRHRRLRRNSAPGRSGWLRSSSSTARRSRRRKSRSRMIQPQRKWPSSPFLFTRGSLG